VIPGSLTTGGHNIIRKSGTNLSGLSLDRRNLDGSKPESLDGSVTL
jgi:hypothetical protein